jgi:hypothetical protein
MPDHSPEAIARRRAKTAERERERKMFASLEAAARLAETMARRRLAARIAQRSAELDAQLPVMLADPALQRRLAEATANVEAHFASLRHKARAPHRRSVRARGGHPTGRRRSRRSTRAGPDDDDPHEPERVRPLIEQFARRAQLGIEQIVWCLDCGVVAFAIDTYQQQQLLKLGWFRGVCPDCREDAEGTS